MSDDAPVEGNATEPYYTETIVEYADNRRQRAILGILLVILFLLLVAAAYAVFTLMPGKGAPDKSKTPPGVTWIRSIYGWGNSPDQALRTPTGVDIADDGTIWVVSGHNTISSYAPDGTPKIAIKPENTVSIEGISVGTDGNLFVTDYGGQIVEFTPKGEYVDSWKVETPQGVDVRDGKIAVSASDGIAVFTEDNSEVIVQVGGVRGWLEDQFDLPHDIITAEDGTMYVTDTQNRRVKALNANGRNIWSLGEAPDRSQAGVADVRTPESKVASSTFLLPAGIAIDGRGRLAVVDPFRFNVTFVDPKTKQIARESAGEGKRGKRAIYGEQGEGDGFFGYPSAIAYDKTRDWFAVADTANNRVQIIRLPETGGSVIASLVGGFRWPMCIFCLPLLLLLLALLLAVMRRRREQEIPPEDEASPGDAQPEAMPPVADAEGVTSP